MKFDITSDLHLAFGGLDTLANAPNPGVDVLLLLGDIIEVNSIKHKTNKGWRKEVIQYLHSLNDQYKLVIYVAGNHCHYGNSFPHTIANLRAVFRKLGLANFVVLENTTIEYEDVIFLGTTLWSTLHNRDPRIMADAATTMNDYHHIWADSYNRTKLAPEDTAYRCEIATRHIQQFIALSTTQKKVLATHMAPSAQSLSPGMFTTAPYFEELSDMLEASDIRVACHGHIHTPTKYWIGKTMVVSNPRGYFGHERQASTHKFLTIEV